MLHFDEIVFGPIASRRLGSSLGVNILPSKGKLCNFDCIYCECGWNKDGAQDRTLPSLADIISALEEAFPKLKKDGAKIDSITFSGNGEPTIHPDFPHVVDEVIRLRDLYYPEAKVSVLSNAAMLANVGVRNALMKVDNPILKIDAPDDVLIGMINKPAGHYKLEDTIRWMKEFDGDFILQTMFLRSDRFDLSEPERLEGWRNIVREVRPREIMVYTIDRETPDKSLGKYKVEEMEAFTAPLVEEGFKIQIRG